MRLSICARLPCRTRSDLLGGGWAARPFSVPAGTFAAADGYINVTSLHDRMFAGLCRAIGREEWLSDPRFATVEARFVHAEEINAVLEATFRIQPTAYWLQELRSNSVVCGPVCGYPEFLSDPQVRHRDIFQEITQQAIPPVPVPRVPGTPQGMAAKSAPRAGEHTLEILTGLGLSTAEIDALFDLGAVASPAHPTQPAQANA